MAKRKRASRVKRSPARSSRQSTNNILGVKYNSLTFLLFLLFVALAAMFLLSKNSGMGTY